MTDSKTDKQQFWGDRLNEPPEMLNVAYCAGRDVAPRPMADQALLPFDVWQNRAHVTMLARQQIIPAESAQRILAALQTLDQRAQAGEFLLDPRKEDVHTNIEHFVASEAGEEYSGTMHTGRSRNDQTTTVVRLYVRDRLLEFGSGLARLVIKLLQTAGEHTEVPVAGFTHYQPASVTTLGHWFSAHAQALTRDLLRLCDCYERLNVSPLGAAASFGTSWPLNRELTARLLGFSAPQVNSLDCISNRWEMEADAASVIAFAMTHLSMLAQDLIVLSLPQIAIVRIADRYVTGSSIMPQKRNPDFAEVTRAKAVIVQNMLASLFGIAKGALSGYNRDTQWTKYLIMDVFDEARDAPGVFSGVVRTLSVDAERAERSARADFVNAVDLADVLAQETGLPFRKAYGIVSQAVKLDEAKGSISPETVAKLAKDAGVTADLKIAEPAVLVARKCHTGGPAPQAVNLALADQWEQLKQIGAQLEAFEAGIASAREDLDKAVKELG